MKVIQGTIKDLAGKIKLNGVTVDQPSLSVLTRLGEGSFCREVGIMKHPDGKGRAAKIWEFDEEAKICMTFTK